MPPTRQNEFPEYPFAGPFGGLQSEVSLSQIGNLGFAEVQNLIFRNAKANLVGSFSPLASPSGEIIVGIADFFNVNGVRRPVVMTPTKMYFYNNGWTQVTGAFTGGVNQFFSSAVVGYKLYFSQQKDNVQVWDGITAGFSQASASALPAKYLMELGFHLVTASILSGGSVLPNRVMWSGIGDGTDWTSFSSGQQDIFNNLGPINGMARLFQSGYLFQQWGITQVVPTGIGLAPFQFITMGAYAKGNILPYSLAAFGELIATYVGKDDIYLFDGTSSQPIGSHPIDGNMRLGARSRIFTDLFAATQSNIFGFILTSASGVTYESYWLFIPSLNKAWVYHFDEANWTQVFFNSGQLTGPVSVFFQSQIPRIVDLVGTIQQQPWSPSTLTAGNPLDTMAIADTNANSISVYQPLVPSSVPTTGSINANDGWYVKSGPLDFDDNRHYHTVNKVRLVINDVGAMTFNLRLTNEKTYQTPVVTVNVGTGSGAPITLVVPIPSGITGAYITWELSGPQGTPFELVEITPYPIVGGEIQSGIPVGSGGAGALTPQQLAP